jgi:hypothetical protein
MLTLMGRGEEEGKRGEKEGKWRKASAEEEEAGYYCGGACGGLDGVRRRPEALYEATP